MSGEPRSSCSAGTVLAPMRSCAGPANRRPVFGAGRNASCRRVTTASCTIRHALAHPAAGIEHHRTRRDAHPDRPASRGDPPDLRHDGEGRRYQREFRTTHLACARPSTAPGETVQRARFLSPIKYSAWDPNNFLISSCPARHGNRPFNGVAGIHCAAQLARNPLKPGFPG